MDHFTRGVGTLTPFGDGVRLWEPMKQRNISVLDRWANALYVTETPIGELAEWRLILEVPIAPMQEKLYAEFALRLAEVLLLFLGALVLASLLSRRVITALEELMVTTSLIPSRLLAQESIVWPESKTLEIDGLIGNYRQMAQALARQFQEIQALNLGLEEKVNARTKELRESEGRFRALLDSVPAIPVQGYDRERRVFFWNQASETLYGFKAEEALGRQLEELIIPPPLRDRVVTAVKRWMAEGEPIPAGELLLQGKDGRPLHVFSSHVLQKNSQGEAELYCIDVDLSARKAAEQVVAASEARLQTLVHNLHVGVIFEDENRKILVANRQICTLFGLALPPEALVGADCRAEIQAVGRLFVEPEQFVARVEELIGRRERVRNEEWQLADGRVFERDYEPILIGGQDRGSLWNYRDITERKRKEKELEQTLQEKETLLREVHHRVKNNMAVISGLLALQAGQIEDEEMRLVFAESQQRVKSLALIHEKLYRAADVSHIDFGEYLQLIANELLAFRHCPDQIVQATIQAERIILDIDTAIPCGLIVNELLTNVMKYAFPGGRHGEIFIGFTKRDRLYTLIVKDNGVGLPAGFERRQLTSLGLQLVEALTAQIHGTWELTSKGGTEAVITFQGKGA